jgi:hypothetical protein
MLVIEILIVLKELLLINITISSTHIFATQ